MIKSNIKTDLNSKYNLKLGFASSHEFALKHAINKGKILDIGGGNGELACLLATNDLTVTVIDKDSNFIQCKNVSNIVWNIEKGISNLDLKDFEQILLLDVIEHLTEPENILQEIEAKFINDSPSILLTVPNIAFILIRIQLLMGSFNYTKTGILDSDHKRFFTLKTIKEMFNLLNLEIIKFEAIPAPLPIFVKNRIVKEVLQPLNLVITKIMPKLFAYQFGFVLRFKK